MSPFRRSGSTSSNPCLTSLELRCVRRLPHGKEAKEKGKNRSPLRRPICIATAKRGERKGEGKKNSATRKPSLRRSGVPPSCGSRTTAEVKEEKVGKGKRMLFCPPRRRAKFFHLTPSGWRRAGKKGRGRKERKETPRQVSNCIPPTIPPRGLRRKREGGGGEEKRIHRRSYLGYPPGNGVSRKGKMGKKKFPSSNFRRSIVGSALIRRVSKVSGRKEEGGKKKEAPTLLRLNAVGSSRMTVFREEPRAAQGRRGGEKKRKRDPTQRCFLSGVGASPL